MSRGKAKWLGKISIEFYLQYSVDWMKPNLIDECAEYLR